MKPLKIILLLTFGVSFKAHSGIKSWYERDDCRMLIHVGCGSDWNPKQLAGLSESFKRALEEGRAGFNNVILANIDHPIYNYNCRQINEGAPFGMFMSLRNLDGKICMGFYTRDSQKKGLEKIPLVEAFNEARNQAPGLSMLGEYYLCGPNAAVVLTKILKGHYGEPLLTCGVENTGAPDASATTEPPLPTSSRRRGSTQ